MADTTHKSLASKPDCISDGSHNWMCALTSLFVAFKKKNLAAAFNKCMKQPERKQSRSHQAAAQLTIGTVHLQPLVSEADQHGQN